MVGVVGNFVKTRVRQKGQKWPIFGINFTGLGQNSLGHIKICISGDLKHLILSLCKGQVKKKDVKKHLIVEKREHFEK